MKLVENVATDPPMVTAEWRRRHPQAHLPSREEQRLWLLAFRDWLRTSEMFAKAQEDNRLRLPEDLRTLVLAATVQAQLLSELDGRASREPR